MPLDRTKPYTPSDALRSHPYWPESYYWNNEDRSGTIDDLDGYIRLHQDGSFARANGFIFKSFYAAVIWERDRLEREVADAPL